MNKLNDEKKYESYLNMWRTLIAVSHLDNIITTQEKDLIDQFISNADLDNKDRNLLEEDIIERKRPDEFLDKVNYPAHLSQLHHLANILFRSDDFDPKEEAYLRKILGQIEGKIGILNATSQSAKSFKTYKNREETYDKRSAFAQIIHFFKK